MFGKIFGRGRGRKNNNGSPRPTFGQKFSRFLNKVNVLDVTGRKRQANARARAYKRAEEKRINNAEMHKLWPVEVQKIVSKRAKEAQQVTNKAQQDAKEAQQVTNEAQQDAKEAMEAMNFEILMSNPALRPPPHKVTVIKQPRHYYGEAMKGGEFVAVGYKSSPTPSRVGSSPRGPNTQKSLRQNNQKAKQSKNLMNNLLNFEENVNTSYVPKKHNLNKNTWNKLSGGQRQATSSSSPRRPGTPPPRNSIQKTNINLHKSNTNRSLQTTITSLNALNTNTNTNKRKEILNLHKKIFKEVEEMKYNWASYLPIYQGYFTYLVNQASNITGKYNYNQNNQTMEKNIRELKQILHHIKNPNMNKKLNGAAAHAANGYNGWVEEYGG